MELKVEREVILKVNDDDLQRAIKAFYGKEYEIVSCEEWPNDTQHRLSIKKTILHQYDLTKLEQWLEGKPVNFILRSILIDLCNKNEIEPGTYLITVSW